MQKNYLLIGGPKDGEWFAIPSPVPTLIVPHYTPRAVSAPLTDAVTYTEETYHLERLRAEKDYLVYRHSSLTIDDVLARLLEHYAPPPHR